ncbi:MAG: putative 4-hydroxybenzoate polyprenyltransferase [Pirellulaceae bacterium]|nr:putative 4-hydroxybenzoate polyprenyltransferase [Pirellulaceae bacterium]
MIYSRIRMLLEMIRFSHTLFALPFALLSAVMAWTTPDPAGDPLSFQWSSLVGILGCMAFGRSAAMSFNRITDRHIDKANPRTASRHLPSGQLTLRQAGWFTAMNSAGFVACTCLFLPNVLPLVLSVPVLLFLLGYSYTKRFTAFAHFWLGGALMLAPVCAWIALRGSQVTQSPADLMPALLLGSAVFLWVAGFDIIYACQDTEFDRQARLYSVPAVWGNLGALRIAATCHLGMLLLLFFLPQLLPGLGWIYYFGLLAVTVLLVYEHALVRPDDLTRVNVAFFQVNAIVSFGIFAVTSLDLLLA